MPISQKQLNQKPVIFLAFANARTNYAPYLRNLPEEQRCIREKLEILSKTGLCEIVERANATIEEIVKVFQDATYKDRIAIFHYGGHADTDSLLLETKTGELSPAYKEGLVSFLARHQSLKLVFLNGCLTEQIAKQLNNAGIPAVIGTYSKIKDEVAKEFANCFYYGIANGWSVQRAWLDTVDYFKMQKRKKLAELYREDVEPENCFPWDVFYKKEVKEATEETTEQAKDEVSEESKEWTLVKEEQMAKLVKSEIRKMIAGAIVSYVVTLLIDLLLGIPWREVKIGSKGLHIDRPGSGWDLWIYYSILAGVWISVCYIFFYRPRKKLHIMSTTGLKFLGVLILAASVSLFLTQIIPIGSVNSISEITGSVKDLKSYSYLFVRPFGSTQCWLQEPIPLQPDYAGKWRAVGNFGGNPGSKYELFLITSKERLEQFTRPGLYDCNKISGHLKQFVRIVKLE
jgi:hypothetical protein